MSKAEMIAEAYELFDEFPRPEEFQYRGDSDPESMDHDNLLRKRDKFTLSLNDIGSTGYNPITNITPEGMGYYMPRIIELSLDVKSVSIHENEPYLWCFVLQLMDGKEQSKFSLFADRHIMFVCKVLHFIKDNYSDFMRDNEFMEEFDHTLRSWCANGA